MSTMSSLDHIRLLFAPESVLWRKNRPQLSRKFLGQQITGQTNVSVHRRTIHNYGKTASSEYLLLIGQQPFEPDAKFGILAAHKNWITQKTLYCAGTGGSILIIGSAAGVAAMGLERIDFLWYMRKISGLALAGYLAGAAVYVLQFHSLH